MLTKNQDLRKWIFFENFDDNRYSPKLLFNMKAINNFD